MNPKEMIIQKLEELIQLIKQDETSDNYTFEYRIIEQKSYQPGELIVTREFAIKRDEYHIKDKDINHL